MMTETEPIPSKIRESLARSGLLTADETVIAYVYGHSLPDASNLLKAALVIPNYWTGRDYRAAVLTDRQLHICTVKSRRAGSLKSIVATYPRGSFAASMNDSDGPTLRLHIGREPVVDNTLINVRARGWMRSSAEAIIAASSERADPRPS
jgi:hypothetical protein